MKSAEGEKKSKHPASRDGSPPSPVIRPMEWWIRQFALLALLAAGACLIHSGAPDEKIMGGVMVGAVIGRWFLNDSSLSDTSDTHDVARFSELVDVVKDMHNELENWECQCGHSHPGTFIVDGSYNVHQNCGLCGCKVFEPVEH